MMISSQVIRSDSLLKLYKKLQENDLHPIVMKGIVCRELYGEYKDHRPSGDEDILIKPSEYERLKEVFEGEGFIPEKEIDYTETEISKLQEVAFFNNTTGLCIEVHFNPVGKENKWNNKANDCFIHVFDNSIEETIDGVVIKTMSHTDHLLFLIVHTLKHFIIKGVGIRQVLDVLLYMKEYGDDCDFDYIYSKVKELNGDLFFSDLIYLGNKYLGFILHTRNKENCPEKLLDDFVDSGVFGNATEARKSASLWNKTALEKKEENKFKKYLYMVFPPISYLRGAKPKLVEKPYLLPVAWFERWKRIIRKANTKKIIESKKLSQERIELLKSYKIL